MWKSTKNPVLRAVINEKALFNTLTQYSNPRYVAIPCRDRESDPME